MLPLLKMILFASQNSACLCHHSYCVTHVSKSLTAQSAWITLLFPLWGLLRSVDGKTKVNPQAKHLVFLLQSRNRMDPERVQEPGTGVGSILHLSKWRSGCVKYLTFCTLELFLGCRGKKSWCKPKTVNSYCSNFLFNGFENASWWRGLKF